MPSQNDSIALRGLSIFSIQSLVPTYGNYCGPGWTAGTRDAVDLATLERISPISITLSNGSTKVSALDNQCRIHDRNYMLAAGQKNEAELIAQADLQFIKGIAANYDSLTSIEKYYASIAIPAFSAKYFFYDSPSFLMSSLKSKISEAINDFNKKSDAQKEVTYTDPEGNTGSYVKKDDGTRIVSYSNQEEKQEITLDEAMRLTGAHQELFDQYGQLTDEIEFDINNFNEITEITYRSGGEIEAEGVIIGKINQKKVEQFVDLADASNADIEKFNSSPNEAFLPNSEVSALNMKASSLLDSFDINVNDNARLEINQWFDDAEAIRLQAYHWDTVTKDLSNLWFFGNDNTLAAYDLQAVMEANHVEWAPDFTSWNFTDSLPLPDQTQFSLNDANAFEFSLSDVDLGIDTSTAGGMYFNSGESMFWDEDSFSSQSWSNSFIDPLVIKISDGAVHTTNLQGSSVMFDMQANGHKVRTGWITPDHAFLVRDRNHNGVIDDSSEMFSDRTSRTASTGFAALAQLDSNRNGWVDFRDKMFKDLLLWTDINIDGVTQKGELRTLAEFGIDYFVVAKPTAKNVYDNGNLILNTNSYHGGNKYGFYSHQIAEVLFNFGDSKPVTSIYISDQATAIRTEEGKTIQVLADKVSQTINASMSGINLLVGGKGDILNAGNSRQSMLVGNGGTTMNGNAGSTHFVVNGIGNIVNTGAGDSFIQVNGDTNTVNAAKGNVQIEVDGSRNKITIGSGDTVNLGGTGNTLTAAGNTKDNQVTVSGLKQVLNLSNADIAVQKDASITLNGKNNDITMEGSSTLSGAASGGTLMVWGEDNVATLSGAFIGLSQGAALQLTGQNDKVVMAGDAKFVLKGSATGDIVNVFGEDNQVTMAGGTVRMAKDSALEVSGGSNAITMLGDGDLRARDKGQRVEVYGDGNHAVINGSTITKHGTTTITVEGTADTVRATANRADQILKEQQTLASTLKSMGAIWDSYDQLVDVSLSQEWRELEPEPVASAATNFIGASAVFGADAASPEAMNALVGLVANASSAANAASAAIQASSLISRSMASAQNATAVFS